MRPLEADEILMKQKRCHHDLICVLCDGLRSNLCGQSTVSLMMREKKGVVA